MNYTMKLSKKLSFGERSPNSVTHAVAPSSCWSYFQFQQSIALSNTVCSVLSGLLSLWSVSFWCFCLRPSTMLCLTIHLKSMYFALSTIPWSTSRSQSYTPVVLTLMNNWMGYSIILIQWGTTIFGILYKIFVQKVNEKFKPRSLLDHGLVGHLYYSPNR